MVRQRRHKNARTTAPTENEKRFRSFFDHSPVGKCMTAPDGKLLQVNQAFGAMLGRSLDEMQSISFADITHPDDLGVSEECVRCLLAGEQDTWSMEKRYLHKDGHYVWTLVTTRLQRNDEGAPDFFLTHIMDTTRRKESDALIERSRKELEIRNRIAEVFLTASGQNMYGEVLDVLLDAFQSRFGTFGFINEDGALVMPSMTRHIWDRCRVPDKRIVFPREQWGDSIWPTAILQRKILHSNERSSRTPRGHVPVERNISAPIIHGGQVVGLFQVANKSTGYNDEDLALAQVIADAIAPILAARLAQQREEVGRRKAESSLKHLNSILRAIRNVNQLIVWEKDPGRLIQGACDLLIETRGYRGAWITIGDPGGRTCHVATAGWRSEQVASFLDVISGGEWPDCLQAALKGDREDAFLLIPSQTCGRCPLADTHCAQGSLVAALRHQDQCFGLLGVAIPQELAVDEEERCLLVEVAEDISFALHGIEQDAKRRKAEAMNQALYEASTEVLGAKDFTTAARTVHGIAKNVIGATSGYVALRIGEDVNGVLFLDSGGAECLVDPDLPMPIRGLLGRCYAQKAPVFENSFPLSAHAPLLPDGHMVLENVLFAPILSDDEVRGVIGLANKPGGFDDEDATRCTKLAQTLTMGLERFGFIDELRASADRFRTYIDRSPLGIFVVDRTGRYTDANPAACTLTGYTREDLLSLTIRDLVPPDQVDIAEGTFRVLEAHGHVEREITLQRANGAHIETILTAAALPDDRFLGFCTDVTVQMKTQEALRTSEEQHRRAQRTARIGHWELDSYTGTPEWSDEIYHIFGLNPGKAPPSFTAHDSIIHPDEWTVLDQAIRKGFEEGEAFDLVFRILRPDSKPGWMHAIGHPERGPDGRVQKMFGTAQDITEIRQKEAQVANLEKQLQQSQRLEAIGQLAGGVAHDFNNLLTVMRNYADLVKDALPQDSRLSEDVSQILDACDRARALTRQLLAFGRRQILEPEPLNLNSVVEGMEEMLGRLIGEHIDLKTILCEAPWTVLADAGEVEQVLMNLVVNARDAMPDGGCLTIETYNCLLDDEYSKNHMGSAVGEYVLLAVSDNGVGMTEDVRNRIFEPFFTTKEKGRGTGLGMSTVYGIVKQSGGSIWVYSEPGSGTTIKVYLPRIAAEARRRERPSTSALLGGTETILLVEDAESVRTLTERMLREAGYRVIASGDPAEAMRLHAEHSEETALLLTDVVMPGMSGKELAERLLTRTPDLRVLYTSGYTDNAIVHHGVLDAGISFLPKPFGRAGLLDAVRRSMGISGHDENADAAVSPIIEDDALRSEGSLAREVNDELACCARSGDASGLRRVVRDRVRPTHPATADLLERLIADYAYDDILAALLEEPSETT